VVRVRLSSGAYTARSIVSSAQRSVNLFVEKGPGGAIINAATGASDGTPEAGGIASGLPILYPTPGLTHLASPPSPAPGRGLYHGNNGTLYYVAGQILFTVSPNWTLTAIGALTSGSNILVSMADNGQTLVLVDGSPNGYQVDFATGAFSPISAATNGPTVPGTFEYAFYGADRIAQVDGYMLFNQPGTRNFYITLNNQVVFDSLNIAAKDGFSDNLVGVVINQRNAWLIGERTTEIWFNSGAQQFPFEIMPGPFVQHGCIAKFSIAQMAESVFWLSQDQTGTGILVETSGYNALRVSTHAIEAEWGSYSTTADAEAFCFQQAGHLFYQINFPTADRSWRYDAITKEWHEAVWSDTDGAEHRHRARCMAFAYGKVVVADWETGELYALDPAALTDDGAPIVRRRGFPHIVGDGDRVFYQSFIADVAVGNYLGTDDPQVQLRWSDDRGRTWGNPIATTMGRTGDYLTSVQFNRLGMARDRVFEVAWSAAVETALQGAFVTFKKAGS
jgi:hypothetical protein